MNIRLTSVFVLAAVVAAQPASALLVWKGRDGKAYSSVKDCFTNNPQCLPEQARAVSGGGGKSDATPPTPSDRSAPPALCRATDGWMSQPPCDRATGQAEVPAPQ